MTKACKPPKRPRRPLASTGPMALRLSLAVKLGSALVHADELLGPRAHDFDRQALAALLADQEVKAWLASFDSGLLPVKR